MSSGNSKPPLELLRGAGIDLTSPQPIASALDYFGRVLDELEELLAPSS